MTHGRQDPAPALPLAGSIGLSILVPERLHEDARDLARSLSKTKAYAQSAKDRKKVEMLFAHMKKIRVYAEVCGLILAFQGSGGRNAATIFSLRKSSSR